MCNVLLGLTMMMCFVGCAKMIPGLTDAIDDMVSENAIEVNVNKEAIQKDTNIDVTVHIVNTEPVVK